MPLHLLVAIGDSVIIGNDIVIKYVKKMGRSVGLAITAPKEIKINRTKGENHGRPNELGCDNRGVDRSK